MIFYQRQSGFTLIEVLIAMTLLGVMVVLLFSSLRIAAESWDAGDKKIVQVNKKAIVYQFFKQHLTNMQSVKIKPEVEEGQEPLEPRMVFDGETQRIRFVSALPLSSAKKGLQTFEVFLDSQSNTIWVKLTPFITGKLLLTDSNQSSASEQVILVDHVKDFKIAYLARSQNNVGVGWQDIWLGGASMPDLIKVSILLDDGKFWPDMIFSVKLAQAGQSSELNPGIN